MTETRFIHSFGVNTPDLKPPGTKSQKETSFSEANLQGGPQNA